MFEMMNKSLGNKRHYITPDQIEEITRIYGEYTKGKYCKIFDNEDFGYTRMAVERPLIENGKVVLDKKGNPKPDTSLRDNEDVPLKEDIDEYFKREVLPHVPEAWIDHSKSKVGYEINFTRYFYEYKPLRSLDEIKADILKLEQETSGMIEKVIEN